jgi:CRISPR-associated endonuclease/helicase Cas3
LRDHLLEVARLAANFAGKFGARDLGYAAGLLHDLGKFNPDFQQYLRASSEGKSLPKVPHSTYGAFVAAQQNLTPLVFSVTGHHCGLQNKADVSWRLAEFGDSGQQEASTALQWLGMSPSAELPGWLDPNDALSCEFLTRMIFSALVDADRLDTENFWDGDKSGVRGRYPSVEALWQRFQKYHETDIAPRAVQNPSPVNQTRAEIYQACLEAAEKDPGIFRLTVPTGGGKTLSGMAFALKHAVKHNLRRVIVAVPYTTIIDQTTDVYREAFARPGEPDPLLEHHSAIEIPADPNEAQEEAELRRQLAAENWDAPIILTTNVQLFESLFSNHPGRCRKLHNISNSVIILDEVQTLPLELLRAMVCILQELVDHYAVTVVLCTATQPALDEQSPYFTGFRSGTEIVPRYGRYFEVLVRVNYQFHREPMQWNELRQLVADEHQWLAVVNRRADALALHEALGDLKPIHLSAQMCPRHRRALLRVIRQRLRQGKECRVVSTQLVEAGVDLDFPLVLRTIGPLDRIAQAAGRCNREGLLPGRGGIHIFVPTEGGAPRGTYRTGIDEAKLILQRDDADLHNPDIYRVFFSQMFRDVNTDSKGIQECRANLEFETTAERAKLIDDNTVPVIVVFPLARGRVERLLAELRAIGTPIRRIWRELSQFSVCIYRSDLMRLLRKGLVREEVPEVYVWQGTYSMETGIAQNVVRDPSDLIQ